MDHPRQTSRNDPLAERLRRDAQLTRPEFSETLHERLRTALHTVAPRESPAASAPGRSLRAVLWSWAIATAMSIALLVGSALVWHTLGRPPRQTIVQTAPVDPAEPPANDVDSTSALVESAATGLGQWMESTLDENQWAGLDRDAATAMATVAGALPFDFSAAIVSTNPAE
jgi:hypothetical protein